ncbi:MAG: hypothetical protein PHT25_08435 [Bacteroidales bacterium]|nr:hypothetical protein [Bacteroidales bacterium]
MAKRSDIEIIEASISNSGGTKIVVIKNNYIQKPTIFDISNISTIYSYIFESDEDYSELINNYNNKVGDQTALEKQIKELAIKRGKRVMALL